jgi:predicted AlkP superfamily pyrophosphatase or phosphodiesterase
MQLTSSWIASSNKASMIYHDQLNEIRKNKRFGGFLYPYYDHSSIAEIGPSLQAYFGLKPTRTCLKVPQLENQALHKQKAVLLLLDGFSYFHFIRYYKKLPFFELMVKKGDLYPLTSVFPSTTPAALTTIHTGLTPQEHGLPEWSVYFEEFDNIIETLPFKTHDMSDPDGLIHQGGTAQMLYSGETVYDQLQQQGIKSYVYLYKKYANSVYSNAVHKGSTVIPFEDGQELAEKFLQHFNNDEGPGYHMLYWGHIDSVAHHFGADSIEYSDAIAAFSSLFMENLLPGIVKEKARETIFLVTADHGHVSITGDYIINLNRYPLIEENFLHSEKGKRILPTGSPRDVFLFIDPNKIHEVVEFLREELIGQAEVLQIDEALNLGLFGIGEISKKFLKRIGNVLVLPYEHYFVWYEFMPGQPYTLRGIHGGLSEDEMIVPLAVAQLSNLIHT